MKTKVRIKAYYPNFFRDELIAYVALRLMRFFNDDHVRADVMGISSKPSFHKEIKSGVTSTHQFKGSPFRGCIYRNAVPAGIIWSLVQRLFSYKQICAFAEWRFFRSLRQGDIVYLWPGVSTRLYRLLKASGFIIISERINTLLANSRSIMNKEYKSQGLMPTHGLTEEAEQEELECMSLSDYIYSPSPGVTESIVNAGISPSKILSVSYGLEPHEICQIQQKTNVEKPVTALFVGTICLRKGAHLLLKAWKKAGANAQLVFVGRISEDVEILFRKALENLQNVTHVGFTDDLGPLYRKADFMILPSLEEGSPLVSYLALGAGIPLLVSPMGAGGIVRDGQEGMIIDPHDEEEFANAIRTMVNNKGLREKMGIAASSRAPYFTWDRVARRRRDLLFSKLFKERNHIFFKEEY